MFCESYRRLLIDSLAAGEPLSAQLARHLSNCGACTSAFAEEKALFAAIDRSLHVAVNGEIPTSLVPGVREAILQREFPTRGMQWRAIFTFASACFVAGTVLFWHSRVVTRKEKPPVVASVAAPRGQEKQIELPAKVSPGIVRSVPHETGTAHANVTRPGGEAMVIVSPQEEDGLKKIRSSCEFKDRKERG